MLADNTILFQEEKQSDSLTPANTSDAAETVTPDNTSVAVETMTDSRQCQ